MQIGNILAKLKSVNRTGDGEYSALCPAHDDAKRSLSLTQQTDRVLIHCHAGCSTQDVCRALDVKLSDLFVEPEKKKRQRIKHDFVCAYDYRDEMGNLLYQNCRFLDAYDDGSSDKTFLQRHFENGNEVWGLNGTRRVPYGLPELLEAIKEKPTRFVILAEGEKDVDNLRLLGFAATSFENWKVDFNPFIKSANIVLLIDHDLSGVKQGNDAAALLNGKVSSLKIVDLYEKQPLPDKHGKDVSDWFSENHTADELREIIKQTPVFENFIAGQPQPNGGGNDKEKPLNVICLNDVQPEDISWLWFPFIALRKLTLVSGEEGLGKSWLTCAFAAAVSTGAGFPPNFEKQTPGNVLMLSAEDGLADTIKPRLLSCEADTTRVFAPDETLSFDEKGLLRLEMYIAETVPVLVTVDPLFAYTPGKVDVNSANQSRSISAVLAKIAEKYNCAILLVRHIGKSKGFGDPRAAGLGSIDWRAAVRSELLIGKNPDNEQERAIVHTKSNLAEFGESVGFLIENTLKGAALKWTGKSALTAACILSNIKDEDQRADQTHSVEFLREILSEGPKPAKEIKKAAADNGLTEQNLRTARNKLGVLVRKQGESFDRSQHFWSWELPEDVNTDNNQHLRQNAANKPINSNGLAKDVSEDDNQHLRAKTNTKDVGGNNNQHLRQSNSKQTLYGDDSAKDVSRNVSNTLGKENPKTYECPNADCRANIPFDEETCPRCQKEAYDF